MIPTEDNELEHSSPSPSPSPSPNKRLQSRRVVRKRIILRRVLWCVLGATLITGVGTGLVIQKAVSVHGELEKTAALIPDLRDQLTAGQNEKASSTFALMERQTSAARSTVTSPLWKFASALPCIGQNFRAVTETAVSANDLVVRAVSPLLETYEFLNLQSLSVSDGRIDVGPLREAAPYIVTAAETVKLSHERLASIELSNVLPAIADPIRSATNQLAEVSGPLETASSAAQLLPAVLGADSPRTYLLLVQNLAEARATGGIPGALAIINTNDGRIMLGKQSSASALGPFKPPFAVDAEQTALYTARLGTQLQNVNLTPDFPTAAGTAKQMWEERHPDQLVDGVLSLDPIVLSHLLTATGPVDISNPDVLRLVEDTKLPLSLTEDNVIPTLLSDVYREIEDPETQDAYFAAVAGQVFAAFTDGRVHTENLIKALRTSMDENRIYLWSSDTDEQRLLSSTSLAGTVVGSGAGGASFGVYFNDGTGAKMDYYAARTVRVEQLCPSEGYSQYAVHVTIKNNAPVDAASSLPAYVTGGSVFGVEPGSVRTNYVFYGPAQAFLETATVNGTPVSLGAGKHALRPVGTVSLQLAPGERSEVVVIFSRVFQDSEPRLAVSPTLDAPQNVILPTTRQACN